MPHHVGLWIAVQEQKRRPAPAARDVELHLAHIDTPYVEPGQREPTPFRFRNQGGRLPRSARPNSLMRRTGWCDGRVTLAHGKIGPHEAHWLALRPGSHDHRRGGGGGDPPPAYRRLPRKR